MAKIPLIFFINQLFMDFKPKYYFLFNFPTIAICPQRGLRQLFQWCAVPKHEPNAGVQEGNGAQRDAVPDDEGERDHVPGADNAKKMELNCIKNFDLKLVKFTRNPLNRFKIRFHK